MNNFAKIFAVGGDAKGANKQQLLLQITPAPHGVPSFDVRTIFQSKHDVNAIDIRGTTIEVMTREIVQALFDGFGQEQADFCFTLFKAEFNGDVITAAYNLSLLQSYVVTCQDSVTHKNKKAMH